MPSILNIILYKFADDEISACGVESKRAVYREAHIEENLDLIERLNGLGMKPSDYEIRRPSVTSSLADLVARRAAIEGYFKRLRSEGRLLTQDEFTELSEEGWIKKGADSNRLLGRDYLLELVEEFSLKHVKVPQKIIVLEGQQGILEVQGYETVHPDRLYSMTLKCSCVYAENITSVERCLSRKEIDELFLIIAAAPFSDLNPSNFMLVEDGVYFIDTEFKSFDRSALDWGKMRRFDRLVAKDDKEYFETKIMEMEQRFPHIEDEHAFKTDEETIAWKASLEKRRAAIQLVAMDVFGHWMSPQTFTFSMSEFVV